MPVKVGGVELPFARKGLPLVRMGLPFARMKMTVARKKITPARTERALIEQELPFCSHRACLDRARTTLSLAPSMP